jgi:hypothetical protein
LGKFLQVDPMADKYGSLTTYNYAGNNPVIFNDPMGDDFWDDIMNDPDGHWENPDKEEQDYQPGVSVFSGIWAFMDRADAMSDALMGVYNPLWNSEQYGSAGGSIIGGGRGRWEIIYKDWWNADTGKYLGATVSRYEYVWEDGQREDPYRADLDEFISFFFKEELAGIQGLARGRYAQMKDWRVTWHIDYNLKYLRNPRTGQLAYGATVPFEDQKKVAIILNPEIFTDARLLYIVIAHELVHARDILSGDSFNWSVENNWTTQEVKDAMEIRAYVRQIQLEQQFGKSFGGVSNLVNLLGIK